ncbi:hypothetical protein [Paenarthrobacter sp. CAP02]|uniref:hypothetical protein n=1 Tax=Paenarthrobacter sp. CAP02 TaxID=3158144 RepID=UPI0032D9FB1E
MGSHNSEDIALHVDGASAIAVGDPDALAILFKKLDIGADEGVPVGRGLADAVAAVSGLGAIGMSASGNWFQMTPNSLAKFHELAGHVANGDVFSAVLRGTDGRFDTFVDLVQSSGINPASVANVHALAAAMALRMALKDIEEAIASLDIKLDRLLQDARTREMGNVQGITHVLSAAYTAYEKTGSVTNNAWDLIADHPTELAQSLFVALGHLETLEEGLSRGSVKERLGQAQFAADGELQHWLMMAALSLANTARMDTLTIARAHDEAEAEYLAGDRESATNELLSATREKIRKLSEAAESLGRLSALTRVRAPRSSIKVAESVDRIQYLLKAFSEVFGMPELKEPPARPGWLRSVADLAKEVGGGVASVPRTIGAAVEDSVLQMAEGINSRRERAEMEPSPELKDQPQAEPKAGVESEPECGAVEVPDAHR